MKLKIKNDDKVSGGEAPDTESDEGKYAAIEDAIQMIRNLQKYGTIDKPKETKDR